MRPVIDDETAEKVVNITDNEFRLPAEHIKFHQRLTVLIEMVEELSQENAELSRENKELKQKLEQSQQSQSSRGGKSW